MINSFVEVIDRLGGATRFAREIGMEPNAARQARKRNSLSPEHFPNVVRLAATKDVHDITAERLMELAAARRKAGRAA